MVNGKENIQTETKGGPNQTKEVPQFQQKGAGLTATRQKDIIYVDLVPNFTTSHGSLTPLPILGTSDPKGQKESFDTAIYNVLYSTTY